MVTTRRRRRRKSWWMRRFSLHGRRRISIIVSVEVATEDLLVEIEDEPINRQGEVVHDHS